jgi:WD40 repeat protein
VESGRVVLPIELHRPASVAWSGDGTALVMARSDLKIDLRDSSFGILRAQLEGATSGGLHASFHPVSNILASNGWENELRLWDANLGRPVLTLNGENSTEPVFSSDGQIVVRSEDRLTTYWIDPADEYRSLIHARRVTTRFHRPSIRGDHRLLALGTSNGVVVWDLARGTECDFLRIAFARQVIFEATGDLLTSGAIGVQRWPVQLDSTRNEFRIGPPRLLPFSRAFGHIAEDRLGRIIATARGTHAEVLIAGHLTPFGPLDDCRYVAVSPDGEWLATGSHPSGNQVWRVRDAEKVTELSVNSGTAVAPSPDRFQYHGGDRHFEVNAGAAVAFSPDGRWLLSARPPCTLWTTGTWALFRELGGTGLCFSPDSRLVASLDASRIIRLIEAESGRVMARLESPDSGRVKWATFSPDGSRLVVVRSDTPAVHVWDLRAIRKRLAVMGLDWDAPAFSDDDPAAASLPPLPPLQVDRGPLNDEVEQFIDPDEAPRRITQPPRKMRTTPRPAATADMP